MEFERFNHDYQRFTEKYTDSKSKIPIQKLIDHLYGYIGIGNESDTEFLQNEKSELSSNNVYPKEDVQHSIQAAKDFLNGYRKINHELNDNYSIKALYHAIRSDIGDFTPNIHYEEIQIPFFFEPPINNSRIDAQHGSLLFEPFSQADSAAEILSLQEAFELEKNTIVICGSKKRDILDDLDKYYGINRHSLFPDYSNGATYVNLH